MKKIVFALLLVMGCSSVGSAQLLTGSASTSAQELYAATAKKKKSGGGGAVTTQEQFLNKWGTKWQYWLQGVAEYGWPKAFFSDMANVMPNRFVWEKAGTQGGYTVYQFVFYVQGSQRYEGNLIFQGSKLYALELNSFG